MNDDEFRAILSKGLADAGQEQKRFKFDLTFNLGHLLTMGGGIFAAMVLYIGFHDSILTNRLDVDNNKKSIAELKETNSTLAKNQQSFASSLEKLTWIVDELQKERASK